MSETHERVPNLWALRCSDGGSREYDSEPMETDGINVGIGRKALIWMKKSGVGESVGLIVSHVEFVD